MNLNRTIRNESDAYDLLQGCFEDKISIDKEFDIKFDGWPVLEIKIEGEKYSSTITPPIMKGLIEFQKGIYRSYAFSKYNTYNINKLSKREKEDLEIQVKVSEGSSLLGIDFQAAFENFLTSVANKLEPTHAIITAISIAVLYFGNSAFRSYLQNRKEIRAQEAKSKESLALIHAQQFASEQETKRAQ